MELIFVQMIGLFTSVSVCGDGDDLCCCDVKAYLSILWRSLNLPIYTYRASKGNRLYWDWNNGPIFFLAALSLCDFITPVRPAKHIG